MRPLLHALLGALSLVVVTSTSAHAQLFRMPEMNAAQIARLGSGSFDQVAGRAFPAHCPCARCQAESVGSPPATLFSAKVSAADPAEWRAAAHDPKWPGYVGAPRGQQLCRTSAADGCFSIIPRS
jgi:hypothetical protein